MQFGFSEAWLVGECPKCKQPATGQYKADNYKFTLECVSCHFKDFYEVDEYGDSYIEVELE